MSVAIIVSHEFAGEIVETGANITRLEVGQRVSGEGHVVGTSSRNANAGRIHLDPETRGVGVKSSGGFAEDPFVPILDATPLPDDVSMEMAAMLDPVDSMPRSDMESNQIQSHQPRKCTKPRLSL